jgi:hypothetical protein
MFDYVDITRLVIKYHISLDDGGKFFNLVKDLEQLFDQKLVKVIEDQSGNGFELLMGLKEENSKLQDRIKYLETTLNDLIYYNEGLKEELKNLKES